MICFAFLAWQVRSGGPTAFDTAVCTWVYAARTPARSAVWTAITYLGNWQTIVALLACLLLAPGTRRRIGLPTAAATGLSTLLYHGMKSIFLRPRPDMAVRLITEHGWSFPSGHSMNGLVCYGMLLCLVWRFCPNRRLAVGLCLGLGALIAAIGCSRVYVGVHYPTDVLGGWSLGLAWLLAARQIWERGVNKRHGGNDL